MGAYARFRARERLPQVMLPGLRTPVRLVTRHADAEAAPTEPRPIRDRSRVPRVTGGADPQAELLERAFAGFPADCATYVSGHPALLDGEEHARSRRARSWNGRPRTCCPLSRTRTRRTCRPSSPTR
ncbi:hypothetical protein [Streptomyces sp. NPDC004680]|uniref:hypothetical protein n=1 Tax=Streptomyces sp. NPDC004680 TaxID=3154287 RepID=UPI0033BAC608